jgi:AraC-like DNA-binding protein
MKKLSNLAQIAFIENNFIISQFRELFRVITTLEWNIIQLGKTSFYPCSRQNKQAKCNTSDCKAVDADIIKETAVKKQPRIYKCEQGFKKILVPLLVNGEVKSILFITEKKAVRFTKKKAEEIAKLLFQVTNNIIDKQTAGFQDIEGIGKTYREKQISRVINYIHQNYQKPELSLKAASSENGISYFHLSRIFREELNTTFVQYCNKVRMNAAVRLLGDLGLAVNQISYKCGFEDPGYFCRVFKAIHKCSPVGYRNRFLKKQNSKKLHYKDKFVH